MMMMTTMMKRLKIKWRTINVDLEDGGNRRQMADNTRPSEASLWRFRFTFFPIHSTVNTDEESSETERRPQRWRHFRYVYVITECWELRICHFSCRRCLLTMSSRHDKRVTMTSSPADAAPLSLPSTAAAFDPFASGETSSTEVDVFALLRLSSLWVIIENIGNRCM